LRPAVVGIADVDREPDGCERYNELPLHVRRYLESMTREQIEASEQFVRRPKKVRDWLLNLDEEDVDALERLKKTYRDAGAVSRFMKWIFLGGIFLFMQFDGFFEKILVLLKITSGK
jgi:hypothetical protein